jgi:hypothetical protein
MTVKASAGPALILAAGLIIAFAVPSPATAAGSESAAASKSEDATSGKSVGHGSRYLKKKRYAHRKSKSTGASKAADKEVAYASGSTTTAIPQSVANANAQMKPADATPDSARAMSEAMSAKANTILLATADKPAEAEAPAEAVVIAPDQLNEVDRALQETPSTQTVAIASLKPAPEAPALSSNDSSTLDQTSLIGKIFIAFGALLTMASAARMFMA